MRVAAFKRFRAWLLLATFVASLGSSGLNLDHLGIIDTACGAVGPSAGTDASRFATASKMGAQHCPVCHFLKAVSGAYASAEARVAVQDGLSVEFVSTTRIPPVVHPITRPSRGPPNATLTFVL